MSKVVTAPKFRELFQISEATELRWEQMGKTTPIRIGRVKRYITTDQSDDVRRVLEAVA